MSDLVQTAEKNQTDDLWRKYKATGDKGAKEALLIGYVPLVKHVVRRMMPKYSGHNEYEDLLSCGMIGLIDAVDKFDLSVGVKFETYAITRVRGEILDYMRSQDWAPSSLRKRINGISEAYEQLESQGQAANDSQVAEKLGISVTQVQKAMAKTHAFNVVNFEDTLSSCYTDVADHESAGPEATVMDKEVKQILAGLIDTLPEKERLVITLYYYEELMLREIAEVLGVSESRVSQIHSKVLAKMRAKLQKLI